MPKYETVDNQVIAMVLPKTKIVKYLIISDLCKWGELVKT